jgi:hypothetical protein
MTNMMDALVYLQAALDKGTVKMRACDIYPELKVLVDQPKGELRLTYASIAAGIVQSIAVFLQVKSVGRVACFHLGCAVIEPRRGRGLGTETVVQALDELRTGLKRNGIREFYLEAVAAKTNVASNRLARRLLSDATRDGTDTISGEPVFHYLKLIK